MTKRKPSLVKPVYYPIEEVYKMVESEYTFLIQPKGYGKKIYLERKKKKQNKPQNKTPL